MGLELIGKKLGMSQLFDANGKLVGVTVIQTGPCPVLQKKTVATDGYQAYQIGFGQRKAQNATKPLAGHCRKANAAPARVIREFRNDDGGLDFNVGDSLTVTQFQAGQFIDVIGVGKGKGFQGVVKRHNFRGGDASHGCTRWHRRTGAIGMRLTPGRVWKNQRMPGRMGGKRITTQNLKVLQIRADENLLLVEGSVPGAIGSTVVVRHAVKKPTPTAKA